MLFSQKFPNSNLPISSMDEYVRFDMIQFISNMLFTGGKLDKDPMYCSVVSIQLFIEVELSSFSIDTVSPENGYNDHYQHILTDLLEFYLKALGKIIFIFYPSPWLSLRNQPFGAGFIFI